jgi:uncharacterized protein (TIGR03437 family)
MKLERKLLILTLVTAFATMPVMLVGYASGPDPASSGAPGDNAAGCAQSGCHAGTGNPTRGSGVDLVFSGGAATYTPGVTQRLTVKISAAVGVLNGFQLSVRPNTDSAAQAGNLEPVDAFTQVLCATGATKPSNGACPTGASVQYIEHSLSGSGKNQWSFDWTPPATNVGPVTFYFAGNAANGNGQNTGDRIYLNSAVATPASTVAAPQIRASQPVLQAFVGGARMSPGTWIEIYGTNLAPSTQDWSGLLTNNNTVAPTSINGVSVTVDGKPAFLYFTSPGQINAQVPDGIGVGPVKVDVVTTGGTSSTTVTASAVSPALLTTPSFNVGGVQYVAALHSDNATFVGRTGLIPGAAFRPAKPGDTIIVYAVGCGATTPATTAGTAVSGALRTVPNTQVRFGQTVATAAAFMSPGLIGLCQFNVTVPNVANGDLDLEATVAGVPTGQGLKITVQQ